MKKSKFDFKLEQAFGNLYRCKSTLITIQNSKGDYLFCTKDDYPEKLWRLIGGGVESGEKPIIAAIRECEEELGLKIREQDLLKTNHISITAVNKNNENFIHEIHIFNINRAIENIIINNEELKDAKFFPEEDLQNLFNQYFKLDELGYHHTKFGSYRWSDFGNVYGTVHKEVFNLEFRNLEIRKATESDFGRLLELYKEGWVDSIIKSFKVDKDVFLKSKKWERDFFVYINSRIQYVIIYLDNIIGTVSINDNFIFGMFIDRRYRSKGVGRQLLKYCLQIIKANKFSDAKLTCMKENIKACSFYKKMGFQVVGECEAKTILFNKDELFAQEYILSKTI